MDASTAHTVATGGKTDEILCQLSEALFLRLQAGQGKQSMSQLLRCLLRVHFHDSTV